MRNASAVEPARDYSVGIISRVSTLQQGEKVSLDQQDEACTYKIRTETPTRAGSLPIHIMESFRDMVSGDGRHRDGLERAKQAVASGQLQELWVFNPDRLGRDMRSILEFLNFCIDHDCRVFFVQDPVGYDEAGNLDPTSKLIVSIKAWVAEQEKKKIRERTIAGKIGMVKQGLQPQRSRAPYGYKVWQKWEALAGACRSDDVGRYAFSPDPLARQVVVEIFERVARRETMRSVAASIQKRGIPSPSGGVIWYPRAVRDIVNAEVYKGTAYYGRHKSMTDKRREAQGLRVSYLVSVPSSEWMSFPAPPMISDDLWQSANDALADNRQFKSGDIEQRFLLSSLLRCPRCGASMGGRKGGHATRWYYVCVRNYSHAGKPLCEDSCSMRSIRSTIIELRVAEALREACTNQAISQMAIRDYLKAASADARGEAVEKERAALLERKEAISRKLRAIRRSMADVRAVDEFANVDGFAEDYARDSAALARIEAEIRALPESRKVADVLPDPQEAAHRVAAMLQRLPEALASPLMTIPEKRDLLDAVLLRAVPIEGESSSKGADWSVRVTIKPEAWNRAYMADMSGIDGESRHCAPDRATDQRKTGR